MKTGIALGMAALGFIGSQQVAMADVISFSYLTLDPPGSTLTQAETMSGVNVVGFYNDSSGTQHGFLYNGTGYTTLDPPGSTSSAAFYSSGSNVVGYYTD